MARKTPMLCRLACLIALTTATLGSTAVVAGAVLPDERGYEMVSPPEKNGGDVMGSSVRLRVAADGSAVVFSSLSTFGDAIGGGVATEYMALRTPETDGQGWSTHAISPALPALSVGVLLGGLEPRYLHDLSPDLSKGVVIGWQPLTDEDPAVAQVANLYVRDDLRTPGGGDYALVSRCPLCITPFPFDQLGAEPRFVVATPDFSTVLFESALNLALGARGTAMKLYQWDAATRTVALTGVFPDGRAALESAAGIGHGRFAQPRVLSEDGRKAFFIATPSGGVQGLYMRLDGTSTVQLNRSEARSPERAQPAGFGDASVSGSRVFLATSEQLTDDAPSGGTSNLYMYDTTKPDSDPHNLTYLGAPDLKAIIGASADGDTLYFTDSHQLIPGLPPLSADVTGAMYAWHEGEGISFIDELPDADQGKLPQSTVDHTPRVSSSGDLIYLSSQPVGPNGYDHGSCPNRNTGACDELYVYRIATHTLSCASCNPTGAPGRANAETTEVVGPGGSLIAGHVSRLITDDGRRVFFTTRDALLPEDINGKRDAYEYDTQTGAVSLLSSGRDPADCYFMEASANGDDAIFLTRERLVGWDHDSNYDLYDARVHGGFPDPPPVAPACAGESCHTPLTTAPALGATSSAQVRSAGNLEGRLKARRAARRCRAGHVRKHVRGRTKCVKRRRAHATQTRRHAAGARPSR